jgi:DNA-binding CsgD family transcriptional regulator
VSGLLERDAELRAIRGMLDGARAGRGALHVLDAPAGLGKSALAARAVELADGLVVLRAAGRELERELGWGVARSLFEGRVDPELLTGPAAAARALFDDGEAETSFAILHGLYWLALRMAERQPLLLVVDDAHWADEPSLRLLLYLAGRLEGQPIAGLVATRPPEGGLLARLAADPAVVGHELGALSPAAVAGLVRERLPHADDDFCARCHRLTAGNPLQLRELLAAVPEESAGPAALTEAVERAARSLSRAVLQRLDGLPVPARALARAVAVFEGGVALHAAAELAGLDGPDAVRAADALERADILGAGDPLEFVHPLLRASVYGTLSRHERADLHGRAARLLAGLGTGAELVGSHLLHAAPAGDADVVAALCRAAATALLHGVPVSAIGYLERALREPPPAGERADVLAVLGRAELIAGRRDAVEHLEAALALTEEPEARGGLLLSLGRTLHDFGRVEEACAAFERGLEEAEGELALDLEAGYLTSAVVVPARATDAHRRVEAILARPDRTAGCAERALTAKALIMRVYAGQGPSDELAALAVELYGGGRLVEEGGVGSQALANVVIALSFCDAYAAVEDAAATALAHVRRHGWTTWYAAMLFVLARQRLWTGPLADAAEDTRAATEIIRDAGQLYLPSATCVLVRALLERDDAAGAEAALAALETVSAVGPFAAWREEATGLLAAQRGDHAAALEAYLACGEHAGRALITNPGLFHWRSQAGLAAARLGRAGQARELVHEERERAERFGAPRAIGVALRAQGLLERGEKAVALLREAAALHAACGAHAEHARSLCELGGAIRRAGRPVEARSVLRESIRLADSVGALAVARAAGAELQRAGGEAPAGADRGRELTPSERRVAALAATGRTNREIADELFVTVKAVEWHLGNTYRKLDIRGRGQLATALEA